MKHLPTFLAKKIRTDNDLDYVNLDDDNLDGNLDERNLDFIR